MHLLWKQWWHFLGPVQMIWSFLLQSSMLHNKWPARALGINFSWHLLAECDRLIALICQLFTPSRMQVLTPIPAMWLSLAKEMLSGMSQAKSFKSVCFSWCFSGLQPRAVIWKEWNLWSNLGNFKHIAGFFWVSQETFCLNVGSVPCRFHSNAPNRAPIMDHMVSTVNGDQDRGH